MSHAGYGHVAHHAKLDRTQDGKLSVQAEELAGCTDYCNHAPKMQEGGESLDRSSGMTTSGQKAMTTMKTIVIATSPLPTWIVAGPT